MNLADSILTASGVVIDAYESTGITHDIVRSAETYIVKNIVGFTEQLTIIQCWLDANGYEIRKKSLDK